MTEEEKKAIDFFENCMKTNSTPYLYKSIPHIKTALNLVKKQQEEIEKKDKIIDEMAIYLADIDFDECCAEIPEPCLSCSWEDYEPHTNCIKQYFENKVEGSK